MRLVLAVFLSLVLCASVQAKENPDPKTVIENFSSRLVEVMRNAQKLGFAGRERYLTPAVGEAYDMRTMAKEALGPSSAKLGNEEVERLAVAFTRFTVANYADQFDDYSGEKIVVAQPRQSVGEKIIVPTQIIPPTGSPVSIDYLMRKDGDGGWHIVDVLLDGTVSQVAVRRSEFVSIYRRDGINGLVETLDQRSASLGH